MCFHPTKIVNPNFSARQGSKFLNIPCGVCDECRDLRRDEYYVRCLANNLTMNEQNGWTKHFLTLTYNPENLPHDHFYISDLSVDDDTDISKYKYLGYLPCFNHQHISTFLKSLRQYFRRDLNCTQLPQFLTVCEYGKNTHRPHYHVAAFVPVIYSFKEFHDLCKRFWHYGFLYNVRIYEADNQLHERDFNNSFKYICKYVSKGSSWLPRYARHEAGTKVLSIDRPLYMNVPRIHTTNGFGANLVHMLRPENYVAGRFSMFVPNDKHEFKSFPVPYYYRRKYFTQTTLRTDLGLQDERTYNPHTCEYDYTIKHKYHSEWIPTESYFNVRSDSFYKSLLNSINRMVSYLSVETFNLIPFREHVQHILPQGACPCEELALYEFHHNYVASSQFEDIKPLSSMNLGNWPLVFSEFLKWDCERRSVNSQTLEDKRQRYYKYHNIKSNYS